MRRVLLLVAILPLAILAGEFEYKGNIGFEMGYFDHGLDAKRDNSKAIFLETELRYESGNSEVVAKLKGIWDADDNSRRYVDFSDLYYRYNFENSDILMGRNTLFWGALEFYNIADVFNTKDFLDDPFDYDSKLGSWNVAYTYYLENSEVSLIAKLHEEDQKMQDSKSIYNFLPLPYNDKLKSKKRPSIFLKYSGSGDEMQIDYSFVYLNGFDNNRYLSVEDGYLRQNAYIVNKFIGFATLVLGDTIYKTELSYALSDDEKVSDYAHVGVGLEHTLYSFLDKKDLGLLAEYYKYESDGESKNLFQNDLMLGFRLSMNDLSSSEVLGGLNIDLDNQEKIFFIKYDTRLFDKYKLALSYQNLSPKSDSVFEKLQSLKLEIGYYF